MAALELCCTTLAAFTVFVLFLSVQLLQPTEVALKYNWLLQTIGDEVVATPGIKLVGPFTSYVRYPKTIQTLEYNQVHRDLLDGRTADGLPLILDLSFQYRLMPESIKLVGPFTSYVRYPKTIQTLEYNQVHRDLLDGRTADGLPLILGLSFQYRLMPERIRDLFFAYENEYGDYERIFKLTGMHMITEMATKFTAYQFFNEKQKIAEDMRMHLNEYFSKHLFATVESLQIQEDDLPEAFTTTILTAATSKQNITRMSKTMAAKIVEFQTARQIAEAQANVTIQNAIGDQHRIMQNGRADAAIIEAYVEAELTAYGKIHGELGLSGEDLINYIWYDTLGGGGVSADTQSDKDVEMLVGVNPSTYISK